MNPPRLRDHLYCVGKVARVSRQACSFCALQLLQAACVALLIAGPGTVQPRAAAEILTAQDYLITSWQKEDGLPSETVYSIAQTPDGFLWVGTLKGLARFDGVQFSTVRQPKELTGQPIARLFVDRSGALWISTESGFLCRYERERYKFLPASSGWPMEPVNSFAQDKDGNIVLSTKAGKVLRLENDHCLTVGTDASGAVSPVELTVDTWGDQTMWIKTKTGIGVVGGQTWGERRPADGQIPKRLGPLTPRHGGGVWGFVSERRLVVMRDGRWPAETKKYPDFMDPCTLLEDSNGNLWIGTTKQGLVRLARDDSVTRFYQGTGFPADTINCAFEDCQGNIWIGGDTGGLLRLAQRKFSTLLASDVPKNSTPLCLSEEAEGALWIGLGEEGLYRLDHAALSGPVTLAGRKMRGTIWTMAHGRHNRMWFGCYGVGVFMAQGETSQIWTLKDGLPSTDLQALCEQPDGSLWIGTALGLCQFDGTNFVDMTELYNLPRSAVHALAQDSAGNLWVGTQAGYLVQYRNREATVFSTTNGLPGQAIQTLLADSKGSLWIGTAEGGLCWHRNGRFFVFNASTGLMTCNIVGIVTDELGYLWLATNRGVLRVSRADLQAVAEGKQERLKIVSFDRSDGLPSTRMCDGSPCVLRLRDGRLLFATLQGLAAVNPGEIRLNEVVPKVVIEDVLANGESLWLPNTGGLVTVPPGAQRVEFRYTAPSLTAAELVHFRHRLEGVDGQWQDAGTQRTVSYRGLRPGPYRFEVMATLQPGNEESKSASVPFEIEPLFWETLWFRAVVASALALAVGVLFRLRMSALEQKRAAQEGLSRRLMEQQEAERKRIAAELHDSLGQSLSIIKNHAVLAARQGTAGPHIEGISEAATDALASVRDICHALRPVELDRLGLTKTLRGITERLAASSGLQIQSEIDPIDALVDSGDWIQVLRFVQEAFNNVVKHARATQVRISLREDEDCLHLVISDDGCGFDQAAAARGRSLGLSSMEERARILKASLRVQSSPGNGTTVRLDLPLRAPAAAPESSAMTN